MDNSVLPKLIQAQLEQDSTHGYVIVNDDETILWTSSAASDLLDVEITPSTSSILAFKQIPGLTEAVRAVLSHDADSQFSVDIAGKSVAVKIKSFRLNQCRYCQVHVYEKSAEDAMTEHQLATLQQQHNQMLDVAAHLFESKANTEDMLDGVTVWQHKRERFSCDIVLTAKCPAGGVKIFLGSFVGGLIPTAVAAFPLAEVFYGMTGKGFGISDIIVEMNDKLQQILPEELFCVAGAVEIDPTAKILAVWNGGLPDLLVVDSESTIKHRVTPHHIPLGLHKMKESDLALLFLETVPGDQTYMMTAGLFNALNSKQQRLEMEQFASLLMQHDNPVEVQQALRKYIADVEQDHDMSLLILDTQQLAQINFETFESNPSRGLPAATWQAKFEFSAEVLKRLDLVPLLINVISQIHAPGTHRQRLYTVLAELCSNALDYGVLQLDSSLKQSPKGFVEYHMLRTLKLANLEQGHISVELSHEPFHSGGMLSILVQDSGPGYDFNQLSLDLTDLSQLSGRGLALVKHLSSDLQVNEKGNCVCATYYWDND